MVISYKAGITLQSSLTEPDVPFAPSSISPSAFTEHVAFPTAFAEVVASSNKTDNEKNKINRVLIYSNMHA